MTAIDRRVIYVRPPDIDHEQFRAVLSPFLPDWPTLAETEA
jgi:hypothetical protein